MGQPGQPIRVLQRALDILEYLRGHPNMGVNQIAKYLRMDKSTVSRQLAFLECRNYVVRHPDTARYQLGHQLLALGAAVQEQSTLRSLALPAMRRLRDETWESVALILPEANCRVCVEQLPALYKVRRDLKVGSLGPIYPLASVDMVFLAWMSPEKRAEIMLGSPYRVDPSELHHELQQVQKRGYACSRGTRAPGSAGVSAPLLNFRKECVGVLIVAGPDFRFTPTTLPYLTVKVLSTAAEICQLLAGELPGWDPQKAAGVAPPPELLDYRRDESGDEASLAL